MCGFKQTSSLTILQTLEIIEGHIFLRLLSNKTILSPGKHVDETHYAYICVYMISIDMCHSNPPKSLNSDVSLYLTSFFLQKRKVLAKKRQLKTIHQDTTKVQSSCTAKRLFSYNTGLPGRPLPGRVHHESWF